MKSLREALKGSIWDKVSDNADNKVVYRLRWKTYKIITGGLVAGVWNKVGYSLWLRLT